MTPDETPRRYGGVWGGLTVDQINLVRHDEDPFAESMRVTIDLPSEPEYDSGWVGVDPGGTHMFTHNLGGDVDRYSVRLDVRHPELGMHHIAYGGMWDAGKWLGYNWQNLTDHSIEVYRHADDRFATQVRVRMWAPDSRPFRAYLPVIRRPAIG